MSVTPSDIHKESAFSVAHVAGVIPKCSNRGFSVSSIFRRSRCLHSLGCFLSSNLKILKMSFRSFKPSTNGWPYQRLLQVSLRQPLRTSGLPPCRTQSHPTWRRRRVLLWLLVSCLTCNLALLHLQRRPANFRFGLNCFYHGYATRLDADFLSCGRCARYRSGRTFRLALVLLQLSLR